MGVIFLNGGHFGSSSGKNRIYTRMAADLAERRQRDRQGRRVGAILHEAALSHRKAEIDDQRHHTDQHDHSECGKCQEVALLLLADG